MTNHNLCGVHECYRDEDNGHQILYWEISTYRMWSCAGCDTGMLEEVYSSDWDNDFSYSYHPPRNIGKLGVKPYRQLPKNLVVIYVECVKSFNEGLHLLCAAGLRALIEGICQSKSIKGSNLEKKIDKLEGILPKNIVECIHSFRFMGNDAVHQLTPPTLEELKLAIDVCEDLMNFLYELDYKAQQLPRKSQQEPSLASDNEGE